MKAEQLAQPDDQVVVEMLVAHHADINGLAEAITVHCQAGFGIKVFFTYVARIWQPFGSMMSHQSLAGCMWLVGNAPLKFRWFSSPGGMGLGNRNFKPNKSVRSPGQLELG